MDNVTLAKGIIEKILYITIASVTPDGKPWNSPVYSAYDEKYNFYWISWTKNQHSKNINHNPNVFLSIYDSTVPEGTGEGVYVQGKAYELTDRTEIEFADELINKRVGDKGRNADLFLNKSPRRMYKVVPEKFWVMGRLVLDGQNVNNRIEIHLP